MFKLNKFKKLATVEKIYLVNNIPDISLDFLGIVNIEQLIFFEFKIIMVDITNIHQQANCAL